MPSEKLTVSGPASVVCVSTAYGSLAGLPSMRCASALRGRHGGGVRVWQITSGGPARRHPRTPAVGAAYRWLCSMSISIACPRGGEGRVGVWKPKRFQSLLSLTSWVQLRGPHSSLSKILAVALWASIGTSAKPVIYLRKTYMACSLLLSTRPVLKVPSETRNSRKQYSNQGRGGPECREANGF